MTTVEGHCTPVDAHAIDIVNGIRRFRQNRIVDDLVTAAIGDLNLNWIRYGVQTGRYTREEEAELYRLIGVSLGHYADAFPTEDDQ